MPKPASRPFLSRRRRRGAAIQLVLGGLLLMGVPALLGESSVAAGFRAFAPLAWLLLLAGAVLWLLPAERPVRPEPSTGAVPLHPEPVHAATHELPPLRRPDADPLDARGASSAHKAGVDTEAPPSAG